jgi:transitional endoplasmic reticulum ATPase
MSSFKGIKINDEYMVKHHVEANSFCDVYTALDESSRDLVNLSIYNASKIAHDDLDENGNLKEIEFLGLGIKGFPKLLGSGAFNYKLERYRYIATEFISGESVMDRMKRTGPLEEYDAMLVGLEIAKICHHIHKRERPILLNGLSLDNIIFDMSGASEKIKLRNLINVRYFDADFKYLHVDGLKPAHLAPESFNNVFTPKTDQYNIGVLIYQMMTGVLPWGEESDLDVKKLKNLEAYLGKRSRSFSFSPIFDEHLKLALLRIFHFDPDQRFKNVLELSTYLKREKLLLSEQEQPKKRIVHEGNGFADIAGMEDLKMQLKTEVLDVLSRPEHFKKYGVTIPNGMLLYGPPGCGKSFISEKFCQEAGFNFFLVKPSDLSSIYVSGGEEKIGQLFSDAEKNAPTVICFDEVDAMMPKRTDDSNHSISARVNEFLSQVNKCSERGIFVIGTTNKPELIDEAMLRTGRLEVKIFIAPPDNSARAKLFSLYLKDRHSDLKIDIDLLADLTENLVASDIEFIVNKAAHKAAMSDERISIDNLKEVISSFSPSINKSTIKAYQQAHEIFSNPDLEAPKSNPIGFRQNK